MRGYPLWFRHRRTRAYADDFYLLEACKRLGELRDLRIGKRKDITAGKKHVSHLWMSLHVLDAGGETRGRVDDRRLPENELASAVRASAEAAVSRHHEHAVGKPLLQPGRQRGTPRQFSKRIPATHRTTSLE